MHIDIASLLKYRDTSKIGESTCVCNVKEVSSFSNIYESDLPNDRSPYEGIKKFILFDFF